MTTLRFYVDDQRSGPLFRRKTQRYGQKVRSAAREAAQDAATIIERLGAGDISRAGNFGTRWTEGLHAKVTEGGGSIRIAVTHDVPYWTVFEYGKVIRGKPMLWIPIADESKGIWARNYPAPLFRVDRKADGLPLLLDKNVASSEDRRNPTQAVRYFGKTQVTIPQKFHLREITRSIAVRLPDIYRDRLREGEE